MSIFDGGLFGDDEGDLGQVLPEPASDALIAELATTGGRLPSRTVEPAPTSETSKPKSIMSPTSWVPYALVGGGVIFAGLIVWSATRPVRANRRRRHRRSR